MFSFSRAAPPPTGNSTRTESAIALLEREAERARCGDHSATALALHKVFAALHEERGELREALRHGRVVAELQPHVAEIERRRLVRIATELHLTERSDTPQTGEPDF